MSQKKKYQDVENPSQTSNQLKIPCYKTPKGWICIGCSLCVSIIFVIYIIVEKIEEYIDGVNNTINEHRIEIDNRNTTISEYSRDFETQGYYKCTPNDPCHFKCSFIRNNLHKKKAECDYDDSTVFPLAILRIIGIFIFSFCLLSCVCGGSRASQK